jgi:hypothetical protein
VWTVVILLQVNNSNPELLAESSHRKKWVSMKYDLDNIVIFGPSTIHSSAPVTYCNDAYQVCLFLSVANINKGNIDVLLEDIKSIYPSKTDKALLLRWSCIRPHWKCCQHVITTNIPIIQNEIIIYGDHWSMMFDILLSLKSNIDVAITAAYHQSMSASCRQWVYEQHHYYSVKYSSYYSSFSS